MATFLSDLSRLVSVWQADIGLDWSKIPPALLPFLIFAFRTTDLTFSILRVLAVVRGRRSLAWVTGFAQALFFVPAIVGVLGNLQNPWNLVAYACGFGTGNVIGILIEGRVAPGHSLLHIVSPGRGSFITETLRNHGLGATELAGRGHEGTVAVVLCYVSRRAVTQVKAKIIATDPDAFVTVENVREVRGGWRA